MRLVDKVLVVGMVVTWTHLIMRGCYQRLRTDAVLPLN
jgi:hypothetical protein